MWAKKVVQRYLKLPNLSGPNVSSVYHNGEYFILENLSTESKAARLHPFVPLAPSLLNEEKRRKELEEKIIELSSFWV